MPLDPTVADKQILLMLPSQRCANIVFAELRGCEVKLEPCQAIIIPFVLVLV